MADLGEVLVIAEGEIRNGNYKTAERFLTNELGKNKHADKHVVLCKRSAVYLELGNFKSALSDAELCIKLNDKYSMGYYCQGLALKNLGDFFQSLVAFAQAMSLEVDNILFLETLVDSALESPLKVSLESIMVQLKDMELDRNPFVVVSVIGQDLLAHNQTSNAVKVLECAISIGTHSLKLKGSVYSALSSALWSLGYFKRSIYYMEEDLKVCKQLGDISGECRAYSNLGAAYSSQSQYKDAILNYNHQLVLAKKITDKNLEAAASSGLGSCHTLTNDHFGAIKCHENAYKIFSALGDTVSMCRELGKVSQSRHLFGDKDGAVRCQKERIELVGKIENEKEKQIVYSDSAQIYRSLKRQNDEMMCLIKFAEISQNISDLTNEIKALTSLGYAARHNGKLPIAKQSYERLLEISLETKNSVLEGRAFANLGIVYHQMGDYEMALKLQARCLKIGAENNDTGGQGRAHGNIGNAYSAMARYDLAVKNHLKELEISHNIGDLESKCSTHGNLAVAYQALHKQDQAIQHFKCQYELAVRIKNISNQSRSLMNLGNTYNGLHDFQQAIKYYNMYLSFIKEHPDQCGEGRALYNLGFAHFSIQEYNEAVSSFEDCVRCLTGGSDKVSLARAYCNLGFAKKALGLFDEAFDCQSQFLTLSTELKSTFGTFKGLGNLGDIYIAKKELNQALGFYQQQLSLAEQHENFNLIAQSCTSIGTTLRLLQQYDLALNFHAREASIYENNVKDWKKEFKAQGRLGATLTNLNQFPKALKCYERQLELSQINKDLVLEAQGLGNLAITFTNLDEHLKAKKFSLSQLEILEQVSTSQKNKSHVYCNLARSCEALNLFDEACTHYKTSLKITKEINQLTLMKRPLKGIIRCYTKTENFRKSLDFALEFAELCEGENNAEDLSWAFGEIGFLHSSLGDNEQALKSLKLQLQIGVENNNAIIKGEAACGIGSISLLIHDHENAINFHTLDLEIATQSENRPCQGRAYGNLGQTYEEMGDYVQGIANQEQHLFIAVEQHDEIAKRCALSAIGRMTLLLPQGDHERARLLLQQAILLPTNNYEEKISTLHGHAIALWACYNTNEAIDNLNRAVSECRTIADKYFSQEHFAPNPAFLKFYKLYTECCSSLLCMFYFAEHYDKSLDIAMELKSMSHRIQGLKDSGFTSSDIQEYSKDNGSIVVYTSITAGNLFVWFINGDNISATYTTLLQEDEDNILVDLVQSLRNDLGIENMESNVENVDSNTEKSMNAQLDKIENSCRYGCKHIQAGKKFLLPKHYPSNGLKHKKAFYALYDLLFGQFDLKKHMTSKLFIVIDSYLFMVPFYMLKMNKLDKYLSCNVNLNIVTSFSQVSNPQNTKMQQDIGRALVIGDQLPGCQNDEVNLIAELLRSETCFPDNKESVLSQFSNYEVVHLSCTINDPNSVIVGDFTITAEELMDYHFTNTKLLVLSPRQNEHTDNTMTNLATFSQSLLSLCDTFMSRGVSAVLTTTWPVPETVVKLFLNYFYTNMLQGKPASQAVDISMERLRTSRQFEHPSYWSGFVLLGSDVILDSRDLSSLYSVRRLVKGNQVDASNAVKLLCHLLEGVKESNDGNPMYISQESVDSKLNGIDGWRGLFSALGFILKPGSSHIPDAIFFPDAIHKQTQWVIFNLLHPLKDLPSGYFDCFGRLASSKETTYQLITWLKQLKQPKIQSSYQIDLKVWLTNGVAQFMRLSGFEKVKEENNEVYLSWKKTCTHLNNLLRVFGALFDEPKPQNDFEQAQNSTTPSGKKIACVLPQTATSSLKVPDPRKSFAEKDHKPQVPNEDSLDNSEGNADDLQLFTQVPYGDSLVVPKPLTPNKINPASHYLRASPNQPIGDGHSNEPKVCVVPPSFENKPVISVGKGYFPSPGAAANLANGDSEYVKVVDQLKGVKVSPIAGREGSKTGGLLVYMTQHKTPTILLNDRSSISPRSGVRDVTVTRSSSKSSSPNQKSKPGHMTSAAESRVQYV